jgi:hypothetical protein
LELSSLGVSRGLFGRSEGSSSSEVVDESLCIGVELSTSERLSSIELGGSIVGEEYVGNELEVERTGVLVAAGIDDEEAMGSDIVAFDSCFPDARPWASWSFWRLCSWFIHRNQDSGLDVTLAGGGAKRCSLTL